MLGVRESIIETSMRCHPARIHLGSGRVSLTIGNLLVVVFISSSEALHSPNVLSA